MDYDIVFVAINRKAMAHPEGFEPPTKEVEAPCSIQLSYGCPRVR